MATVLTASAPSESDALAAGVAAYQMACERARTDYHTFARLVLRDEKGRPITYAAFHRMIFDFVSDCWNHDLYAGVLAMVQHGKTMLGVEGRILWEIGRDPNLRVRIVSGADSESTKRVATVKRYIEDASAPEFHDVFPDCRPARGESWTDGKIHVARTSKVRDPTLEGSPVIGIRAGASHDRLYFDDPVTAHNTIYNPGTRVKVYEAIGFWLQRVTPETKVALYGFRHRSDDAYGLLMASGGSRWKWLVVRVSDDCSHYEARIETQDTVRDRTRKVVV